MNNIYEEHNLRIGDHVIKLSWIDPVNGRIRTQLYRYDTAADWMKDYLRKASITVEQEWVAWDGVTEVSLDNGD